jgi:hypothetical protein
MASKANIGQISPVFEVLNGFVWAGCFLSLILAILAIVNFCSDFE